MTIKQKQCLLAYLGYYTGTPDGIWGPLSIGATERLQNAYGLMVTGIFDGELEVRIRADIGAGKEIFASGKPPDKPEGGKTGTFWDDIRYFTRNEFRCPCGKCGGFPAEPEERLVRAVDEMRKALGVPVIVVPPDGHSGGSGVRCQAYNDSLRGSAPNSRHVQGKAADFSAPGASAATIERYLADIQSRGVIRYWYRISPGAYHMDIT